VRLRDGVRLHKTFARGQLAEVVAPGADRVTAACPHYTGDRCGGCQLQHMTYEAQLAAKRALVGDALRRSAKPDLPDPALADAVASPSRPASRGRPPRLCATRSPSPIATRSSAGGSRWMVPRA